jgi:small conductance mechanosensitive channel
MNLKSFFESFVSDAKTSAIKHVPPIIKSIAIIIVAFIIAAIVKKYILNLSKDTDTRPNNDKILYDLLSTISYYIIVIIGFFMALVNLGFNLGSVLVIFGSIGLAIALSIQNTIAQMVSGMVIVSFKYFNLGDLIEVNGIMGYVDRFNLFNTSLSLPTGEKVVIPNNTITNNSFKNYFEKDQIYADTFIKISNNNKANYDILCEHIKTEMLAKCKYIQNSTVTVTVNDISEPGTKVRVRFLIKSRDYYAATTQSRQIVRSLLTEENILLLDNYYINNQASNFRGNNYS